FFITIKTREVIQIELCFSIQQAYSRHHCISFPIVLPEKMEMTGIVNGHRNKYRSFLVLDAWHDGDERHGIGGHPQIIFICFYFPEGSCPEAVIRPLYLVLGMGSQSIADGAPIFCSKFLDPALMQRAHMHGVQSGFNALEPAAVSNGSGDPHTFFRQ